MLLLGILVIGFAIALTIHTYMRCSYWDEWDEIAAIAKGRNPAALGWLWSQHNEHRLATTRLLIWLDVAVFGAKNISLFLEIYLVQLLHWGLICYVIERLTRFPRSLKRTLEGVFAFSLFTPMQAENLTWAFQVSFVLCFALGTAALLGIAFLERARRRAPILLYVALAPLIAATNLSAGLLLGPVALALAWLKRVPRRYIIALAGVFLASVLLYLWNYRNPDSAHSPLRALSAPWDLVAYTLMYFDTSWIPFPHKYPFLAPASLVGFFALVVRAIRQRDKITNFEWFCLAECALMLATAVLTAFGRVHFGLSQAGSGRYQTPAMLYWASLCSLALIATWQVRPSLLRNAQRLVLLGAVCSLIFFPGLWSANVAMALRNRNACDALVSGRYDETAVKQLYPSSGDAVQTALQLLRERWGGR